MTAVQLKAPTEKLSFEPIEHVYTLQELDTSKRQTIPSVTDVLVALKIITPKWYTPKARIRGKAVHLATMYLDQGRLNWESIKATEEALEQNVTGYVRAWERYKTDTGFVSKLIETPQYHEVHRYGGTPDRVGGFPD